MEPATKPAPELEPELIVEQAQLEAPLRPSSPLQAVAAALTAAGSPRALVPEHAAFACLCAEASEVLEGDVDVHASALAAGTTGADLAPANDAEQPLEALLRTASQLPHLIEQVCALGALWNVPMPAVDGAWPSAPAVAGADGGSAAAASAAPADEDDDDTYRRRRETALQDAPGMRDMQATIARVIARTRYLGPFLTPTRLDARGSSGVTTGGVHSALASMASALLGAASRSSSMWARQYGVHGAVAADAAGGDEGAPSGDGAAASRGHSSSSRPNKTHQRKAKALKSGTELLTGSRTASAGSNAGAASRDDVKRGLAFGLSNGRLVDCHCCVQRWYRCATANVDTTVRDCGAPVKHSRAGRPAGKTTLANDGLQGFSDTDDDAVAGGGANSVSTSGSSGGGGGLSARQRARAAAERIAGLNPCVEGGMSLQRLLRLLRTPGAVRMEALAHHRGDDVAPVREGADGVVDAADSDAAATARAVLRSWARPAAVEAAMLASAAATPTSARSCGSAVSSVAVDATPATAGSRDAWHAPPAAKPDRSACLCVACTAVTAPGEAGLDARCAFVDQRRCFAVTLHLAEALVKHAATVRVDAATRTIWALVCPEHECRPPHRQASPADNDPSGDGATAVSGSKRDRRRISGSDAEAAAAAISDDGGTVVGRRSSGRARKRRVLDDGEPAPDADAADGCSDGDDEFDSDLDDAGSITGTSVHGSSGGSSDAASVTSSVHRSGSTGAASALPSRSPRPFAEPYILRFVNVSTLVPLPEELVPLAPGWQPTSAAGGVAGPHQPSSASLWSDPSSVASDALHRSGSAPPPPLLAPSLSRLESSVSNFTMSTDGDSASVVELAATTSAVAASTATTHSDAVLPAAPTATAAALALDRATSLLGAPFPLEIDTAAASMAPPSSLATGTSTRRSSSGRLRRTPSSAPVLASGASSVCGSTGAGSFPFGDHGFTPDAAVHHLLRIGYSAPFELLDVGDAEGRKVTSRAYVPAGAFVCEYAGQLVDAHEARRREKRYTFARCGSYVFHFMHAGRQHVIDATAERVEYGVGRLLNHSRKNPSLQPKVFVVDGVPRLAMIAKKAIQYGDKLTYDYGEHNARALELFPWLSNS